MNSTLYLVEESALYHGNGSTTFPFPFFPFFLFRIIHFIYTIAAYVTHDRRVKIEKYSNGFAP